MLIGLSDELLTKIEAIAATLNLKKEELIEKILQNYCAGENNSKNSTPEPNLQPDNSRTNRKAILSHAGEELQESEEALRVLVDAYPEAIVLIDTDGIIQKCNATFAYRFGKYSDVMFGESLYNIWPADVIESRKIHIEKVMTSGLAVRFEDVRMDRNIDNYIYPILDMNKKVNRVVVVGVDITDRKQAEGYLVDLNERFDLALKSASLGIWDWNISKDLLIWDDGMYKLCGIKKEDFSDASESWKKVIYPEDLERENEDVQKALKGEKEFDTEFRIVWPNNNIRHIKAFARVIRDETGKPARMVGVNFDITERKLAENELVKHKEHLEELVKERTSELNSKNARLVEEIAERKRVEEALRESEERLRSFYENVPIGLYRTTPEGKILLSNPALVSILGYPSYEELSIRNLEKEGFEPDYSRDQFREKLEQDGEIKGLEVTWTKLNGSTIFVRESAKAIKSKDGKIVYYEGTVEDITEHKRAEEALRKREAEFNAIFNSITDAIIFSNAQREIVLTNPAFTNMFGYTMEEVIGKTTKLLYIDKNSYNIQQEKYKMGDIKGRHLFEVMYKRKDNTIFPAETLGIPVKDSDNKIIGYAGIHRNITERKMAESEHSRLQNLESLGILASGIAHDFRNILTVIKGQSGILQMKCPNEDVKKNISKILEATEIATDLTHQLLTFAQGGPLQNSLISIRKLIEDSAKYSLSDSDIVTEFHFGETQLIEVDPAQIRQVLQNIITNAKEAMPKGGKILILTSDNFENNTSFIEIVIKDTGIGIPQEFVDKIFTPYYSTKQRSKEKGSGLGLSVCHSIIKRHGGKIVVDSQVGIGTSFKILLPITKNAVKFKGD